MRVLIIEDYEPLRSALVTGLREEGYVVDGTSDGTEGMWYATNLVYDAIVLDLNLPGLDGFGVLRRLRSERIETHVLILTARDRAEDRIAGLDCGADAYMVKPFALPELLARIRALARRRMDEKHPVVRAGSLEINTATRVVSYHGRHVPLTAREYAILEYLTLRAGHVVTRNELLRNLYTIADDTTSNVIDVYIRFLRRKLDQPEMPSLIQTRRGQGYILVAEP